MIAWLKEVSPTAPRSAWPGADGGAEGAFVNEMLGASKEKESLPGFISAAMHVVRLHFGSIDVSAPLPTSFIPFLYPELHI